MERHSLLSTQRSYCVWGEEKSQCAFNSAQMDLYSAFLVTLLVSLITALIQVPLTALFVVLSAPSEKEIRASLLASQAMRQMNGVSAVAPHSENTSIETFSPTRHIPDETQSAHKQARVALTALLESHSQSMLLRIFKGKEERTIDELRGILPQQRALLAHREQRLFDDAWMWNDLTKAFRALSHTQYKDAPVVEREISRIISSAEHESRDVVETRLRGAVDTHIGLEILQLFVLDLLGRDSTAARIFEGKVEEDFQHVQLVSVHAKLAAGLFVLLVNVFFVYFTMLKANQQGVAWQTSLLYNFFFQVLLEIIIFETIETLWINFFVPSLVNKDLQRIQQTLAEAVQHLACLLTSPHAAERDGASSRIVLNAPEYLFVSTRVAEQFPHLMESWIVLAYRSYLPGQLARQWHGAPIADSPFAGDNDMESKNAKNARVAVPTGDEEAGWQVVASEKERANTATSHTHRWSLKGLLVLLNSLMILCTSVAFSVLILIASMPFRIQRSLVRLSQPFVVGGVLFLFSLVISNTIYLVAACCCVTLVLIYLLKLARKDWIASQRRVEQERRNALVLQAAIRRQYTHNYSPFPASPNNTEQRELNKAETQRCVNSIPGVEMDTESERECICVTKWEDERVANSASPSLHLSGDSSSSLGAADNFSIESFILSSENEKGDV